MQEGSCQGLHWQWGGSPCLGEDQTWVSNPVTPTSWKFNKPNKVGQKTYSVECIIFLWMSQFVPTLKERPTLPSNPIINYTNWETK